MLWSYRSFLKGVFPVAALVFLSACENPYVAELKRDFGWTEARMTRDGWLPSRKIAPPDTWCYSSLAAIECYDQPIPAETRRLVGTFNLPPGI